ncbi:hypothetical protein QEM11_003457 [Pseudomonas putida]|uniref:hypothetical protein n=1 Tax=Pseudomonas putida TaxID=303 RepID=UPI002A09884C|nr:hypothetical protein [Pseudomonas putida]
MSAFSMSFTFDYYLTATCCETWDNPIDLRYLFDGLAPWAGLVWVMRGDQYFLSPQLTGIGAYERDESVPIEIRLFETPSLDTLTLYLVTAELNRRNGFDDRAAETHEAHLQSLINKLPAATVHYVGRA